MKFFICLFLVSTSICIAADKKPKYSKVREAKVLVKDSVRKIISQDGSADKIIFNKHAGIFYLKSSSKHHAMIKAALINSQKSGALVQVKANATTLEIEELIP